MNPAIEEFASIFVFSHTESTFVKGDLCYEIRRYKYEEYDPILEAVQGLRSMYLKNYFIFLVNLLGKKEVLDSKKGFMSAVLSGCMKLSENPTLYSFLFVCTFFGNLLVSVCGDEFDCFKFAKFTSKCMIAVIYRRYMDLFEKENGLKEFASFCRKLNETVLHDPMEVSSDSDSENSLDLEGLTPPDIDVVIELLQTFKDIDDSEFLLTDFEKKLLYDLDELPLIINPAEDVFIPSYESFAEKHEEYMSNRRVGLKSDWIIEWNEVLRRINQICPMCNENCYKYVVLVAEKLKICEKGLLK